MFYEKPLVTIINGNCKTLFRIFIFWKAHVYLVGAVGYVVENNITFRRRADDFSIHSYIKWLTIVRLQVHKMILLSPCTQSKEHYQENKNQLFSLTNQHGSKSIQYK